MTVASIARTESSYLQRLSPLLQNSREMNTNIFWRMNLKMNKEKNPGNSTLSYSRE
jgi:hypothetical protein